MSSFCRNWGHFIFSTFISFSVQKTVVHLITTFYNITCTLPPVVALNCSFPSLLISLTLRASGFTSFTRPSFTFTHTGFETALKFVNWCCSSIWNSLSGSITYMLISWTYSYLDLSTVVTFYWTSLYLYTHKHNLVLGLQRK